MFFSIEIFFKLSFFLVGLYYHVDKIFILSSSGTKLRKYVNTKALQNVTGSLDSANKENSYFNFFGKAYKSSKSKYKYYTFLILVSIALMAIKLALTYNFLISNFFYINFFGKQILISSILSDKYIYFKIFYYLASYYFIFYIISKISKYILKRNEKNNKKEKLENDNFLLLGTSEKGDKVSIDKVGAFQNILITGSIGSGKTSSAITNILDGLIKANIPGLIIDVKGNYINTVKKVLKKYGCEDKLVEISLDSSYNYNPLSQDISAIEMADILKKVLMLMSKGNASDPFWLDKVEEYIRDFIIISKAVKGYVTFYEIHNMVIDSEYLDSNIKTLKKYILENRYTDEQLFSISSALQTITNEYSKLDERTLNIIKSEITRITSVFVTDYNVYEKFSSNSQPLDFLSNKIVILSIDFGSNKKIAKILSTYLKLDFQRQVVSNFSGKDVFFICDEYQEFANEEDSHFFSISREYKCINVISMQSYNSLINTLGDEKASNVIIQNLVNKIFFRNDDSFTINEVIKLLGREVKENKSISFSEGGDNARFNMLFNNFKSYKSSLSQSYTVTEKEEYLIDESYLTRKLKTFEALCFISDGTNIKIHKKVKFKRWEE